MSICRASNRALSGQPTKKDDGRGHGLRTTIKIICEGLKGEILLISGASLVSKSSDKDFIKSTLEDFYWKGLIVAFRIPKTTKKIDIYKYL